MAASLCRWDLRDLCVKNVRGNRFEAGIRWGAGKKLGLDGGMAGAVPLGFA